MLVFLLQTNNKRKSFIKQESSLRNIQIMKNIINEKGGHLATDDQDDNYFLNSNSQFIDSIFEKEKCLDLKIHSVSAAMYLDLKTYQGHSFVYSISKKTNIRRRYQFYSLLIEGIVACLAIISILLSIYDFSNYRCVYAVNSSQAEVNNSDSFKKFMSFIVVVMVVLNIISIYLNDQFQFQNGISFKGDVWYKEYIIRIILETLIILPHPIPFGVKDLNLNNIEKKWNGEYDYDNTNNTYNKYLYLYALSILKVYFYSTFLLKLSKFNSIINHDICYRNSTNVSYYFLIKCIMKTRGYVIIIYTLVHVILLNTYLLQLFAYNCYATNAYYNDTFNCVFFIITTMTTVGYGEENVKEIISKLMLIVSILFGQFLISLMILWSNHAILLDKRGEKAFILLKRLVMRKKIISLSQKMIAISFRTAVLKLKLKREYQSLIGLEKTEKGWIYKEKRTYDDLTEKEKKYFFSNKKVCNNKIKLKSLNEKIVNIKLELNKENFSIKENKYFDIDQNINNDINCIKSSIGNLNDFALLVKKKISNQQKHIFNLKLLKNKINLLKKEAYSNEEEIILQSKIRKKSNRYTIFDHSHETDNSINSCESVNKILLQNENPDQFCVKTKNIKKLSMFTFESMKVLERLSAATIK